LIELKPFSYGAFRCPECSSGQVGVLGPIFAGAHVLADLRCADCGLEFIEDFPVGHALRHPVTLRKDSATVSCVGGPPAFSRELLEDYRSPNREQVPIVLTRRRTCDRVVLLNCLDGVFGDVLRRLLNAQYYLEHEPELGLLVLIPRALEWLVPDQVAELWSVDVPLSRAGRWFHSVDTFVQEQLQRFEKVYLSLAFPYPDPATIQIKKFTRVKPFDFAHYYDHALQVTFVSREDRLWFPSNLQGVAYRIARRLPVKRAALKLAVEQQDRRFEAVADRVRQVIPDAQFALVGIGAQHELKGIEDLRATRPTTEQERAWCELYARSHMAIGVHGSNMLLPTAHAAGFIDIVPDDLQSGLGQDTLRAVPGRHAHWLGRFVDERVEPGEVAHQALDMFMGFEKHCITMHEDYLKHGRYRDVTRWRRAWHQASTRWDDVPVSETTAIEASPIYPDQATSSPEPAAPASAEALLGEKRPPGVSR
jgi:hypothetical protein